MEKFILLKTKNFALININIMQCIQCVINRIDISAQILNNKNRFGMEKVNQTK